MFHKRQGRSKSEQAPPAEPARATEEYELVVRAQQDDQHAFEQLYIRYIDRICRYLAHMVGNDGVGCELAQDTFLKSWRSLKSLENPASFSSWLYRIATNCAYTYLHQSKAQQHLPWEECSQEIEKLSVAGPEEQVALAELVATAFERISPLHRSCLYLAVIEKLSHRKIAEMLETKESCVSQYVSRGKKEMRHYYRLASEATIGGKEQAQ